MDKCKAYVVLMPADKNLTQAMEWFLAQGLNHSSVAFHKPISALLQVKEFKVVETSIFFKEMSYSNANQLVVALETWKK